MKSPMVEFELEFVDDTKKIVEIPKYLPFSFVQHCRSVLTKSTKISGGKTSVGGSAIDDLNKVQTKLAKKVLSVDDLDVVKTRVLDNLFGFYQDQILPKKKE